MTDPIAQEAIMAVNQAISKTNRLRQAFMADYCLNGTPDDDCRVCEFARTHTYWQIKSKALEWLQEKQEIASDHLMGDDPGIACSDYPAEYFGNKDFKEYTSQPF